MTLKTKRILLYLNIFLSIISIAVITCNNVAERITERQTQVREDSLQAIDLRYRNKAQQYKEKADSLNRKLQQTDSMFKREKEKVSHLKIQVRLKTQEDWKQLPPDTQIEKCDSLKEAVNLYIAEQAKTDSLKDEKIATLETLVTEQEKQIIHCDSSYREIKQNLEQSIEDTKAFAEKLRKAERKLKRKQFFNKVLATGAVIATTVAATLLLKK